VLRILIAIPLAVSYTLLLGIPVLLAGALDRSGRLSFFLVRLWARAVLGTAGVRVEVSGAGNAQHGPAIYAANHASALDIPILFGHLPVPFRVIHKRSLYLLPMVGAYLYLGGHIGIDRGKAFRARRSLERAAARIRSGTSVAVFPEGTRSGDEKVRLFKRGSFLLALNAGVPVVPVSLAGVMRVMPRGVLTLRPGRVSVRIHPAVATTGRDPAEAEAMAEEVRRIVAGGCQEAVPDVGA
jgi:1-acyl-sn-glycerol-3-phosphate acyltransferase